MRTKSTVLGFTILDILFTTAIVSLLSSLILFNVTEARKKADDAHMITETKEVEKAIRLYKEDNNGKVPAPVTAKGMFVRESSTEYKQALGQLVPKYLSEIPTSPNGNSYSYMVDDTTDPTEAVFVSQLKKPRPSVVSSNNSCSLRPDPNKQTLDQPIEYIAGSYTSCTPFNYETYQSPCNGTPSFDSVSQKCFVTSQVKRTMQGGNILINTLSSYCSQTCDGKSSSPSFVPDIICQTELALTGNCSPPSNSPLNGFICNLKQVELPPADESVINPLCDGTRENEYCSCI